MLKHVIEYCEYHYENPSNKLERPLMHELEDLICDWDKKFLEKSGIQIVEILMASNYLGLEDLKDLLSAKMATMMKGRSAEHIRQTFNLENDFTKEEEEEIKKENDWCQEA